MMRFIIRNWYMSMEVKKPYNFLLQTGDSGKAVV